MGIGTAIVNSRAARKAADTQANATNRAADLSAEAARVATEETRRQFDLSRSDMQPWMQAGTGALDRLKRAATGDFSDFTESPDYQFTRSEGMRDIGNSFAARGGAAGGNALKALSQYNSGLAAGQFGDWWNRQAGLAGVGQSAVNASSQLGANAAANIAGINNNAANQIGNFGVMGANARASGIINAQNAQNQSSANTAQWMGRFMGWGK